LTSIDAIREVARRYHGVSISLFGSLAIGAESDTSDGDFLVQFEPGSSLFDLLHLQDDLEELLECAVDVVSIGASSPSSCSIA